LAAVSGLRRQAGVAGLSNFSRTASTTNWSQEIFSTADFSWISANFSKLRDAPGWMLIVIWVLSMVSGVGLRLSELLIRRKFYFANGYKKAANAKFDLQTAKHHVKT
jgi:hypothetical protein